jgi:hypothetical protein
LLDKLVELGYLAVSDADRHCQLTNAGDAVLQLLMQVGSVPVVDRWEDE